MRKTYCLVASTVVNGGSGRDRTCDQEFMRLLLSPLSYRSLGKLYMAPQPRFELGTNRLTVCCAACCATGEHCQRTLVAGPGVGPGLRVYGTRQSTGTVTRHTKRKVELLINWIEFVSSKVQQACYACCYKQTHSTRWQRLTQHEHFYSAIKRIFSEI